MTRVYKTFDKIAEEYDANRRRFIACFDDLYGLPMQFLQLETSAPQVLDIGAGTGLLSAFVLERYPHAQLTLVDMADKMLDVARQRFAGREDVSFLNADFTTCELQAGAYDAVVSALAIHHLAGPEKEALYNKCFAWLKPGGVFLNIDQMLGSTPQVEAMYAALWMEALQQTGLTEEELEAGKQRMAYDRPSGMEEQLGWLRSAGFSDVDCLYKYAHFGVLYAKKAH